MTRLAHLGCGHMCKAMLKGMLRADADKPDPLISQHIISVTSEASANKLKEEFANEGERVKVYSTQSLKAVEEADVVLLAFPPGQLTNVLSESNIAEKIQGKFIISILAGISQEQIRDLLPKAESDNSKTTTSIVRAIPSLGAQAYESATLLVVEDPKPPEHLQNLAEAVFATIGKIHHTPPHLFNSLTSLGGVVNALMSITIDALADACVVDGIPREHTLSMAGQSFVGYAALIASGVDPSALKNSLLIPNGLTANAMISLERGGVRRAIHDAVRETSIYTESMGKKQ